MHNKVLNEGFTLHDRNLSESERSNLLIIRIVHLLTWMICLLSVIYLVIKFALSLESFMIILAAFGIIGLIASLLYCMKYNSWIGNNSVVCLILIFYIIGNIIFFIFVMVIEFSSLVKFSKYKSAKNSTVQKLLRIIFFSIPVLHCFCIIALWYYRRKIDSDIDIHSQNKYSAKGRLSLSYKPQTDEKKIGKEDKKIDNIQI